MSDATGPSEVQRYCMDIRSARAHDGPYVLYTDHAALAERLKACEEEKRKLSEMWDEAAESFLNESNRLATDLKLAEDERIEWVKRGEHAEAQVNDLTADLAAARAEVESSRAVTRALSRGFVEMTRESFEQMIADTKKARAKSTCLTTALEELYGQVMQAKEGFNMYHRSPSMDSALLKAQAALTDPPAKRGGFAAEQQD